MNNFRLIKKSISLIIIITFLSTNSAYTLPIKEDALRPPLQTAPGNVDMQRRLLNRDSDAKALKGIATLASNETVFTEEQKEDILKEIQKYCNTSIQSAEASLREVYKSGLVTPQNQEAFFTILKEIPEYAGACTPEAYNSLINLLKLGLITQTNQEQIFAILKETPKHTVIFTPEAYDSLINLLKLGLITENNQEQIFTILREIPQYAKSLTYAAYDSLIILLKSDLITQANQEQIFTILKEIPQYAKRSTWSAYDSLTNLLKSGLITETNQEQILRDFLNILKEIPKYAGIFTSEAYNSLANLLKSGLITQANQEQIFAILKETPKHTVIFTPEAYDIFTNLLKSGLITETNQEQIFTILKEIPEYAKDSTPEAYSNLITILSLGLITQANQKQIFTIMKEIPQYAKGETPQAFRSLTSLLKALNQKQINLTENDLKVIINMIKEQGDVSATLNVIKDLVSEFRDPDEGQGQDNTNSLSAALLNPVRGYTSTSEHQKIATLASNETVFTKEQKKDILKEIRKYCYFSGRKKAEESLQGIYKSGLVTPNNQEALSTILKEIPKYAGIFTSEAYNSLANLLKSGLITQANQEQIFIILKEIPKYAKDPTSLAYDIFTNLLKSGLITETNQEQIFTILKEIPEYAKDSTPEAYSNLITILSLGLITQANQKQIFTIMKEIPQYAGSGTPQALESLTTLLETLKKKRIDLTENDLKVIINMIKDQGDVSDTLNVIKELALQVKDPDEGQSPGNSNSLSAALLNPVRGYTSTSEHQKIATLASNQTVFTEEQKKDILKEIQKYCGLVIRDAEVSLQEIYKSGLVTSQNQEALFTILKKIPQYAGTYTSQVYNSIIPLLNTGWQVEDIADATNMIMHRQIKTGEYYKTSDILSMFNIGLGHVRFDKVVQGLISAPIGTKHILEAEPTISQLVFSTIAIDFEVAVYPMFDNWIIVRGDNKKVGIEDWSALSRNKSFLVHNHPEGLPLPSPADLMLFKRGGIGLIISGRNNIYSLVLFKTPQINPETGKEFASDTEMYELFKRKQAEYEKAFKSDISLNQIQDIMLRYIRETGTELIVMSNITNEDENLSVTEFVKKYQAKIATLASNETVFTEEQKKDILKEIQKYCSLGIKEAEAYLQGIYKSDFVTSQNQEAIFTILKEIPQYAGIYIPNAYYSLTNLLNLGLITQANQEQILRDFSSILKEISQYARGSNYEAYDSLIHLLKPGLITEANQEQILRDFSNILKEISQYAGGSPYDAYNSLANLLKSGLITQTNQEQIFTITKEIPKYAGGYTRVVYNSLINLLQSDLITQTNQEQILRDFSDILHEIYQYAEGSTWRAYDSLTNLLQSGLITQTNREQIFTIMKEIPKYAGGSTWVAYNSLTYILKSDLITEANQEQIFTIMKEIPQYTGSRALQAFESLIGLLKALKKKRINLTDNDLKVIINMIKEQGDVSATLDVIRDLALQVKDPDENQGLDNSNSLSAVLLNPVRGYTPTGEHQGIATLASNQTAFTPLEKAADGSKPVSALTVREPFGSLTGFTEEQKQDILKEIQKYCHPKIQETEASLQGIYKSGLATPQNQEALFTILREIPQYAKDSASEAYYSLVILLNLGLITEANQEQILRDFTNILKEIPQYAEDYTWRAYNSLTNLLNLGLITKTNQEQIFAIMKEIPQYAGYSTYAAYNSLTDLLKSGLITQTNQEQILRDFTNILREIPKYAQGSTYKAYNILTDLLRPGLITKANHEQIFAITKEIPKYAGSETPQALESLTGLLEVLKKKQINLTENDLKVIINMIKEQGDVSDTLNVIKDLALQVKDPDEGQSPGNSNSLSAALLNPVRGYTPTGEHQKITTLASNETVFTKEQKKEILEEIQKYCGPRIKDAEAYLQRIDVLGIITTQNREAIFIILKKIPKYAESSTWIAYISLTNLIESGLITKNNQEQILINFLDILKEIPQYAGSETFQAYNSLANLLKPGLITQANQKQIFTILKEIPQYAAGFTPRAYNSLAKLLKSGLITETNQEQILRDFSNILKEIPQYAGGYTDSAYENLTKLLRSGLITETNQEQIFAILKEIPKYEGTHVYVVYDSLTDLLRSGLITQANQEQIFAILKEIPKYAGGKTEAAKKIPLYAEGGIALAYNNLANLLRSGLVTETNQEQIFTILKEIPQYVGGSTWLAYNSLINLLKLGVITKTNQEQILRNFIDIFKEIPPQYVGTYIPKVYIVSLINLLESGLITETNQEQILRDFSNILKEISQYAGGSPYDAYNSLANLLKSGLITQANQEQIFAILKEIPQYARLYTHEAYIGFIKLHRSGLITETNQEQIFTILKEIPQYAGIYTPEAYSNLITLLSLGLITEANQKQIFTIMKEIPQYARGGTSQAFQSLIGLLKALKKKRINLTENDLKVIIKMIKEQGDVSATLNVIKDLVSEFRDPEEGQDNTNSLRLALLNPVRGHTQTGEHQKIATLASNETAFTEEQKEEILKEIQKYCSPRIQEAEESLQGIYKSGLVTPQNQEALFTTFKEIPQYVEYDTYRVYNSLTNLLKSGLITQANQEQILRDFSNILKKVPQYAKGTTWVAYDSLINLLASGLITQANQEQILTILRKIPQYAESSTWRVYDSLTNLLKSGLITQANQEQILTILREIPQYAGNSTWIAYDIFTDLLKSGLITETNQEQIFTILKEIPEYAKDSTPEAYSNLITILSLGLITQANQKQIFTIMKEIPQYAGSGTPQALESLTTLLETLKKKRINLTENDLKVIINMIKEQGDVSASLDFVKDIVLRVKDPDEGQSPGNSNSLSAALLNPVRGHTQTSEHQKIATLASNETVFTKEQKKEILEEIQKYCLRRIQETIESLQGIYKSGFVTSQNQEAFFTILKEIPQYAKDYTLEAYDSLVILLNLGLITQTNQEQILRDFSNILREIPQYAKGSTWVAYNSLINLLNLGLITQTNQEQIFTILKEIPKYAKDLTCRAYDNLTNLLKLNLITEANQEQILRDFSDILKEIPQYAKGSTWVAYDNLINNLLSPGLITGANQQQVFAIAKQIPQYAAGFTPIAYNNLAKLLKSGLITETNREQIFTIMKEIPQYAGSETPQALESLTSLLETLKKKQINLTENDLKVITKMIKEQGDVSDTLNVIKDLALQVKDPDEGQGPGNSNSLNGLANIKSEELGSPEAGMALERISAEIRKRQLDSAISKGDSLETYNFGIELEQLSLRRILVLKLNSKKFPSISDIRDHPAINELNQRKILLTPYIVTQIEPNKLKSIRSYFDELDRQIKKFGSRLASIQPEYLSEPEKTIFYNYLHREYPSIMARVGFEGFENNSLVFYILSSLRGGEFYVYDSDILEMINLSLTIDEMVRRYVTKKHPQDDLWITSFREQVKLHTEFIRWYLSSIKPGGIEIKHTLEYFILSALSIYGGMFGEEMDEFKHILDESINKHFDIFTKLSLGDKSLARIDIPSLIDRLLYESFSTLDKKKDPNLLWKVKPYQRAYYSLLRCVETGEPGLFVLSGNTHGAFEEALEKVSSDTRGEVFKIPLSYFSERSDLFGMNVPDEQGNPQFLLGAIPRLIEKAKTNPDVPIYLVLDNIEAVQGSLRVELNPILWEKSIVIPEINKRFNLPKNMHIMFTMDESGELHDEAFLNRVLRQKIGGMDKEDLENLLVNKHQISQEWAKRLSGLYLRLMQETWRQKNMQFASQDFVNIAIYAKNIGADIKFLKEEAYRYLILKFRYESDRKKFAVLFKDLFGAIPENYKYSQIEMKGNKLIADGVQMHISGEFSGYIKDNPGKTFSEIVLQNYGYAIRKIDNMLISQLARQAAFKDEAVARVTVLEGISGEGKTQLCQVISRIMGYKNLGFTVHKRSSLEEFRGGIFPGKDGLVTQNDTPFLKAEREGGYLINFSELNTSYKGALLYWLYPEFSHASTRLLPEIPAPLSRKEPFYSNPVSSSNLYVVDINPDDYRARERIPQQMRNFSSSFWMGYDYSEKDSDYQKSVKEEIQGLIKGLFRIHFSGISGKEMDRYSIILGELYYSIQKDLSNGRIRSLYQVLTLRDIIRTIKMFRYYHDEKGQDQELAFRNAIKTCLWLMWQEKEPSEKIKARLEEMGLWREELEITDVIKDVLFSDIGHLIIHSNAVGDGYDTIKEMLAASGKIHYMSANDFIELESLTGGVSVDLDGKLGVFPGALLKVIEEAEANPDRKHFFVLDNFHQLNPDTAVGLNKTLQEGRIELSPAVCSVYKGRLIEGRFALIPENLKIIALTYITKEPSHDDKLPMSGAELSRLVSVAIPGSMTDEWLEGYMEYRLSKMGMGKKTAEKVISLAKDIFETYVKEYENGNHSQMRLSKIDFDEYLAQILKNKDNLDPQVIEGIAYYTLAMGLGDQAREPFRPRSPPSVEYTQKKDGIYLKTGSVEYKTNYSDMDFNKRQAFLCPVDEILEVYQAALSGFGEGRKVTMLEGPPGGGKTAIAEDIAKRLNLRFKKVSMHSDIDLWEFLGKIDKIGPNKFKITCTKEEGKFLSEFLDFVENGGIYCFDEANISKASVEAISFLTQIIRGEPIDLGIYHNGVDIGTHTVNIHPDFKAFITINPWETTKERKDIPLEILWLAKKIHVTDNWKEESYRKLIDYYLKDKGAISEGDTASLIRLHIFMKYIMDAEFKDSYKGDVPREVKEFSFSQFNELYTYQYGVSPRELIRIIDMVNNKKSLFEAILLNYLFQFSAASDLNAAVGIIETVFPGFKEFFDKWQKGTVVYFGEKKVELEGSKYKGLFMPVGSQTASLKALSLSLSGGGQHTLIISEQGSYPMELVRFFSEVMGCELYIFDANPFVNSVELLGGQMVSFGDFNPKGVAKSADRLETVLGFIGTHLVREDEYNKDTAKDKPMKILYLSSIEMVPGEELELLNDFLNTGRINIGGQNYVLPENVRIVVETSVLRQKRFSSPFYNRFQKIGLGAIAAENEVFSYLDKYYPGVTQEEKTLIYGAAKLAWYLDMGRYDANFNLSHKKFTYRYGFSMKDIYKLAELATLDKMNQGNKAQIDSVKTILRCVLRLYGNDLDDMSNKDKHSDRKIYFNALFEEVFDYEGIDEATLRELEAQLRDVKREWISVRISAEELRQGATLANGFRVETEGEDIVINTAINKYRANREALHKEIEFSPGLKAMLEKDTLVLSVSLIKSIGGMDSGMDYAYSIPPEEVPRGDYISYEGAINEVASAIFWASRRTEDATGRVRTALPVILMGKTGGAKSTIVRNLSQVTGVPLYTLHCYENMETDAFFAGMNILQEGKERRVLLYLKEFFSHLGKINGEYYYPEGKDSHSLRKILFLDEANVSPQMLYCLKPLFRGEKKFVFYLLGERFTVELDPEVILILAGNPAETYAARKNFSWEIIEDGLRIWVPALHTYLESERVKKEDLVAILFGMHKRKMRELQTDTEERGAYSIKREKMRNNSCEVIKLEKPEAGSYKIYKKGPTGFKSGEKDNEKTLPPAIRKDISFKYSVQMIEENLRTIGSITDNTAKYQYFLDRILRGYLLALSDGAADIKGYKEGNKTSLTFRVLEAARSFDEGLFKCLENIVYSRLSASYTQLKQGLLKLRKSVLKNKAVNRFIFSFPFTVKGELHILAEAKEIKDTVSLEKEQLERLGIAIDKYKDKIPLVSYVVGNHPFMEEEKARGVFKGENYALIYESSTLAHSSNISRDTLLSWVGYHELGHLVDHLRTLGEQITPHPNIELFSMLFPAIFSKDNKGYMEKELLYLLKIEKDQSSYYCQAAKGIFNGFLRVMKEENPEDSRLQEIEEITDSFEDGSIDAIYSRMIKLGEETISNMGIKLYKDAWEKRFAGYYYLSSTKKGRYKQKSDKSRGDAISEFTEGIANPPDVEIQEGSQEEIEQRIEIASDAEEKEELPAIEFDEAGKGKGGKGEISGEGVVIDKGWLETYYQKLGSFAVKFIDMFASEPKQEEVHTASGRKLDIRKWITLSQKVFRKSILEESTPSLCMSVTVDISGSIMSRENLVKAFTSMTKFFESLLYIAGKNAPSVKFSLSAIGEEFHRIFGFDECKNEDVLRRSVQTLWQQNDFGGINTKSLVEGLKMQYGQSAIQSENRLHIVLTDGEERSGKSFEELRKMVNSFEEEYNVDVIFIGIKTEDVTNYGRYLLLKEEPDDSQLMNILLRIAKEKVQRGTLPMGDLGKELGMEDITLKSKKGSASAGYNRNYNPQQLLPLASNETALTILRGNPSILRRFTDI